MITAYVTQTFKNFLGLSAKNCGYDYKDNLMCYLYKFNSTNYNADLQISVGGIMQYYATGLEYANLTKFELSTITEITLPDKMCKVNTTDGFEKIYCAKLQPKTIKTINKESSTNEEKDYESVFDVPASGRFSESPWFSDYYAKLRNNNDKAVAQTWETYAELNKVQNGYDLDEYRAYGIPRTPLVNDKSYLPYDDIIIPSKDPIMPNVAIIGVNTYHSSINNDAFKQSLTTAIPAVVIDFGGTYATYGNAFKVASNINGLIMAE